MSSDIRAGCEAGLEGKAGLRIDWRRGLSLQSGTGLPIGIVLFNNQRYRSMEGSLLKYFPSGSAKKTGVRYGSTIDPSSDYRLFAEAYGGFGVLVDKPEELRPAIEQAVAHLRQGDSS